MRILFCTEGGPGRGWGHASRCSALAHAFKEAGHTISVLLDGPASLLELFPAGEETQIFRWQDDVTQLLRHASDAAVLVIDSYELEQANLEYICDANSILPLLFDDTKRLVPPRGILLNGAPATERLYPASIRNSSVQYLLGPQYQVLRPAFTDCPPHPTRKAIQNILLSVGADDILNIAPTIIKNLIKQFPDLRISFITTSASRSFESCKELLHPPHKILIDIQAEAVVQAALNADLAICAAGQSSLEFARCGLPSILLQVAQNQEYNVQALVQSGVALGSILATEHLDFNVVNQLIKHAEDTTVREHCTLSGQTLFDGNAVQRILISVNQLLSVSL